MEYGIGQIITFDYEPVLPRGTAATVTAKGEILGLSSSGRVLIVKIIEAQDADPDTRAELIGSTRPIDRRTVTSVEGSAIERSCGTCRWFDATYAPNEDDPELAYGLCEWPAERLPASLRGGNRERSAMNPADGRDCPCWELRVEGKAAA